MKKVSRILDHLCLQKLLNQFVTQAADRVPHCARPVASDRIGREYHT